MYDPITPPLRDLLTQILHAADAPMSLTGILNRPGILGVQSSLDVIRELCHLIEAGAVERVATDMPVAVFRWTGKAEPAQVITPATYEERILAVLPKPPHTMTAADIARATKLTRNMVNERLTVLAHVGEARPVGKGAHVAWQRRKFTDTSTRTITAHLRCGVRPASGQKSRIDIVRDHVPRAPQRTSLQKIQINTGIARGTVRASLDALGRRGLVRKFGTTANAEWQAVNADDPNDGHIDLRAKLDALERLATKADAYTASVVAQIKTDLQGICA